MKISRPRNRTSSSSSSSIKPRVSTKPFAPLSQFWDWLRMSDWASEYEIYRDGGGSCSLYDRTFWVFCDTAAYSRTTGELIGFSSNSMTAETDYNIASDQRYALWTFTNCVQLTETRAMHFFLVEKFSNTNFPTVTGNTMAIYTMDPDTNEITIERPERYWFGNTTYTFGSFANVVVDNVAYLYGLDTVYSGSYDVHLARVPVGSETNKTSYSYYDAASGEFSSTMPVPTTRRQDNAVIRGTQPFDTGTVFWSDYHNAFLLVYLLLDSTFRVASAPSPVGHWNVSDTLLAESTAGVGPNYGGVAVPIYYQQPGQVAGKELLLAYTYQNTTHKYPKILQVTF
ncbi:hypothetical protein V1522DRAFT_438766 [Lipomyces starkeyi]